MAERTRPEAGTTCDAHFRARRPIRADPSSTGFVPAPARADGNTVRFDGWAGMNFQGLGRRILRSPTLWIALAMLVASASATLAVGIHLFHHTSTPMIYDRR